MLTLFNEHQNMTIMNTRKKSYSTPATYMQLVVSARIICVSGGYSVSGGEVVNGGNSGNDPGSGL